MNGVSSRRFGRITLRLGFLRRIGRWSAEQTQAQFGCNAAPTVPNANQERGKFPRSFDPAVNAVYCAEI